MSNYTKTTNFATKDNLSPGNPLKIVKGTEIDTEYNNIATAVATKTDNSAAAITGGTITGITDLAVADGGTGASTAAAALNNLLPSQTSNANKYLQTDGTNATWDAVSLSTADITGTLGVANGGTGVTTSTGTTNVVLSNSPTLVTPALGTPSAAVLTNATGLPISTGVSGLGTGVATLLATPSSANLAAAITDETGSGALVFATSPTLVTPVLGTPTSGVATNLTGLPLTTGVTGLLPVANGGTATATPSLVAGTNVTVTGTWPNQTIAASGGTGTVTSVAATVPSIFSISGSPITTSGTLAMTYSGTALPVVNGGTGETSYTNGQLLIGNTTGNTLTKATLTAGTGVTITNGSGSITIAASGGTGDVVGPASSTDNAITRFDSTTGKLVQTSLVTVADDGAITAPQVGSVIPFYYANQAAFPSAATYHGALAHSHSDGAMYFAHSSAWVRLIDTGGPLGTPSSGTLTNATGLPISTGVSGLGSGIATFLATPSSANLASAITNETGTGSLVFGTAPALSNPTVTAYTETVYALSGTAIDPANGTIQTKTLGANTTFTESLADGQSVVLMLNPVTYTVTWPTMTWINAAGSGSSPTLEASSTNVVVIWQVGGTVYGNWAGSA